MIQTVLRDFIMPMIKRPSSQQVALLCYRLKGTEREYLLVTSRDTGRWVIPKGWIKKGKSAERSALEEGWEEAGIVPKKTRPHQVGTYTYNKKLGKGLVVTVEVNVFEVELSKLENKYPEVSERKRRWMTRDEAAEAVHEPSLTKLLQSLP
ncbi:NUDIX hydrolase [Donghicola sp. B5-SW-15]|uniref:NUDIX hydrolase n=2 Tax=Donghicola mangrovi TaxID=2729614 RepID=A0A850Q786_9RHOB|nr:NUDIX hydrolase [Donghicola mangrovi]